jgi:hypothetical protein
MEYNLTYTPMDQARKGGVVRPAWAAQPNGRSMGGKMGILITKFNFLHSRYFKLFMRIKKKFNK